VKIVPPITLAPETEKVVDDTIRVRHSTSITNAWKAEIEVKGKVSAWFLEVETALRGGIEKSTNQTYGVETEKKRSVTIKGTKPVRVVWVDLYRTGKAKVELDGQEMELPFEFKEDFDLLTETVASGPSR